MYIHLKVYIHMVFCALHFIPSFNKDASKMYKFFFCNLPLKIYNTWSSYHIFYILFVYFCSLFEGSQVECFCSSWKTLINTYTTYIAPLFTIPHAKNTCTFTISQLLLYVLVWFIKLLQKHCRVFTKRTDIICILPGK